jgi:hypothetical protein
MVQRAIHSHHHQYWRRPYQPVGQSRHVHADRATLQFDGGLYVWCEKAYDGGPCRAQWGRPLAIGEESAVMPTIRQPALPDRHHQTRNPGSDAGACVAAKGPVHIRGARSHKTPKIKAWLARVERWFAELTRKRLRHGVHTSVRQLEADIRTFIDRHNENPKPFKRTKSADQILASVKRFCQKTQQTLCGELEIHVTR